MPYVTRSLNESGAVVELMIGVTEARREILAKNGLPIPGRVRVFAQIDPGSSLSGIDLGVLRQLAVTPTNTIHARTTSPTAGTQEFEQFPVSISLAAGEIEMLVESVEVLGCVFGTEEPIRAILGRDVLKRCLFIYDGQASMFSLAF